ncbi:hypothetical protein BD410DRAFT_898274 [Rickenella mellea]|uniref:Uncharacterized protein n=1 Tax=Rickenella mellea TaxID=50990 RepID=A0A4Y7Q4T2_9AGAM|nr:hypothetical protein BD410DRAFT_898274 [Rickenella mellea]
MDNGEDVSSNASTVSVSDNSGEPQSPTSERIVRFEERCVLIPEMVHERSKGPRIVTKSFSLPLWRKGSFTMGTTVHPPPETDQDDDHPSYAENNHVTVKLPIPSITLKAMPKSPPRAEVVPLPPCLTHRSLHPARAESASSPSTSTSPPRARLARSPSLPTAPTLATLQTVPLRPCCPACVHTAEAALLPDWNEDVRFSKGALRRRRSASVERYAFELNHNHNHGANHTGSGSLLPLRVDEVDRKRTRSSSPPPPCPSTSPLRISTNGCSSKSAGSVGTAYSIPTLEKIADDEDQLFPLPSPKRTPTSSPRASPIPSPSASSTNVVLPDAASRSGGAVKDNMRVNFPSVSAKDAQKANGTAQPAATGGTQRSESPTATTLILGVVRVPSPLPIAIPPSSKKDKDQEVSLNSPMSSPPSSPSMENHPSPPSSPLFYSPSQSSVVTTPASSPPQKDSRTFSLSSSGTSPSILSNLMDHSAISPSTSSPSSHPPSSYIPPSQTTRHTSGSPPSPSTSPPTSPPSSFTTPSSLSDGNTDASKRRPRRPSFPKPGSLLKAGAGVLKGMNLSSSIGSMNGQTSGGVRLAL